MVYLAGTELRVWSPVINSMALTKSAVMCHLLLTSTDEWSWGGSLAHMQIRDTYAWMITEIREYMHECKHMDTDRLFPYVHREDTHSPTHTHFTEVVPYLLYLLYPTKPTRVLLQLECSQNYSISHILNGPTSTLMVTHTHTHSYTLGRASPHSWTLTENTVGPYTICSGLERQKIEKGKKKSMNMTLRRPTFCPNRIPAVSVRFHGPHWLVLPLIHPI